MLRTTLLPRPRRLAAGHFQVRWFSTTHRRWNAGRPSPPPSSSSVEQSNSKATEDPTSPASSPSKSFQLVGDTGTGTGIGAQSEPFKTENLDVPKSQPLPTSTGEPADTRNPKDTFPSASTSKRNSDVEKPNHSNTESSVNGSLDKVDLSVEVVKDRFREWSERAAIVIRHRADDFTSTTKTTFSQLGAHLNKATGYEEIEALKKQVVEQEARIKETREAAKEANVLHDEAVAKRSNSQREVNDLLQRKSHWTDSDVGRFTTLVRQDHLYEQEEARAKATVDETEARVEREFSQLMRLILARYHEEQVWSDKIRSASTYGSLAALGLNLVVFILAIILVEPWKRRRLAQTFERKVDELAKDNATRLEAGMAEVGRQLGEQEALLAGVAAEVKLALSQLEKGVALSSLLSISEVLEDKPIPVVSDTVPTPAGGASSSRSWELAVVGAGAFITGVVSCIFLGR